jgi:copper/silver efflux system protein
VTAIATTIVGFVPVFFLTDAEGKLFRPLAFTKTFALLASLIVAIYVIPPVMHAILKIRQRRGPRRNIFYEGLIYAGGVAAFFLGWQAGLALIAVGAYHLIEPKIPLRWYPGFRLALNLAVAAAAAGILSHYWSPLGPTRGTWANFLFAAGLIASILGAFLLFLRVYPFWLRFGLNHKKAFLVLPSALILLGLTIWQGYDRLWGWLPRLVNAAPPAKALARLLPGLGEEFMPPLDEGAFLLMPSTMPHVAIGEAQDILQKQDMALSAIPEIDTVVGKIGRTASPLDPAPIAMFETVINYHPEYMRDAGGNLLRFSFSAGEKDLARRPNGLPLLAEDGASYHIEGRFLRDENLGLIPDPNGRPYRLWRPALDPALNPGRRPWPGIRDANDIWQAVSRTAHIPGTTAAAKLQPISARIVMLQSGIRASLGVKVKGPDIISVEAVAGQIEGFLREVPAIEPATVIADRIMAKPYLEIEIDRKAIAQYGIRLATVLDVIEFAIGGRPITTTVEGRARYPVRVRYLRELRDDLESLGRILVPASDNTQIPLTQLARIQYARGPEVIKGENTFPTGYVLFDKKAQYSDGEVVDKAAAYLKEMLDSGQWVLPSGVSYSFTGTYENQIRSRQRLAVIIPVSLLVIFIILYLQFHSAATSSIVFTGIAVAASGGFLMLWLYAQPWFLNFELFGVSIRQLFSIHPIHLSVAIWVGFLALFGIATDDGVVMATYLQQAFSENRPLTIAQIRETAVTAALRRVRPCLMTSATTIIALLPVLSSAGRGSEIMIPMAIPAFGGMTVGMISMLVVPVIYCWIQEHARVKSQET